MYDEEYHGGEHADNKEQQQQCKTTLVAKNRNELHMNKKK